MSAFKNYILHLRSIGRPIPILSPNIIVTEQTANQVVIIWEDLNAPAWTDFEYQISSSDDFTGAISVSTTDTSLTINASGTGIEEFYFRVRAKKDTSYTSWSTQFIDIDAIIPLGDLVPIANAESAQLRITYNDLRNVDYVYNIIVQYKLSSSGTWLTDGNFDPEVQAGADYILDGLTDDLSYDVRMIAEPSPTDYAHSQKISSISTATPSTATPTLTAPSVKVTPDFTTNGKMYVGLNAAVTNAETYTVEIRKQSDNSLVSTSDNAFGVFPITYTGLIVGTAYNISVVAKDTDLIYNDSPATVKSFTPQDVESDDSVIPESYGAEAYYLPADGRRHYTAYVKSWPEYLEENKALINSEATEADRANLTAIKAVRTADIAQAVSENEYIDYPLLKYTPNVGGGYTTIEAVGATNFFPTDIVGKRFCGLNNHHINTAPLSTSIDSHIGFSINPIYCTVTERLSATQVKVNFVFNGGDVGTPQIQNDGKGYFFKDNSSALNQAIDAVALATSSGKLRLQPMTINGYVMTAYVAPDIEQLTPLNPDTKVLTATTDKAWLKFGREKYNYLQIEEGSISTPQAGALFNMTTTVDTFVCHNVYLLPPHETFLTADIGASFSRDVFTGELDGGAVAIAANTWSYAELFAIEQGQGITFENHYIRQGNLQLSGTYTGDGTTSTDDVQAFGMELHKGFHYTGAFAGGQKNSGANGGANYLARQYGTIDFEDQLELAPSTQSFTAKFTDDFSGLPQEVIDNPHYINCLEITDNSGNFYVSSAMGGAERTLILQVDKFVYLAMINVRYQHFKNYYELFYRGSDAYYDWDDGNIPPHTSTKMIMHEQITRKYEDDGTTPKYYTISREYLTGNSFSEMQGTPKMYATLGIPVRNAVRTAINWCLVLDKYADDLTQNDLDYISAHNRRPVGFQVDEKFRLCAWVDVASTTGFEVGDTVTDQSGATGTIREIDTHLFVNRIIIGSANQAFALADNLDNGSSTSAISAASIYDPTVVYNMGRKQRGLVCNDGEHTFNYNGTDYTFYAGDYAYGVKLNTTSWNGTYHYSCLFVDTYLPDVINGDDDNNPLMWIEMVETKAEHLLDGTARPCRHTYLGNNKFNGNYMPDADAATAGNVYKHKLSSNAVVGYGTSTTDGAPSNNIATFDDPNHAWTQAGDPSGHMDYTVAEITEWNDAVDFRNSKARRNKSQLNGDNLMMSKGLHMINCVRTPIQHYPNFEKLSSALQWEKQRVIIAANPSHPNTAATAADLMGQGHPVFGLWNTPDSALLTASGSNPEDNMVQEAATTNAPDLHPDIQTVLDLLP